MSELVLDSSTSFIRSYSPRKGFQVTLKLAELGTEEKEQPASNDDERQDYRHRNETPAHAALPFFAVGSGLYIDFGLSVVSHDIAIPFLAPPFSRIDRPPIV